MFLLQAREMAQQLKICTGLTEDLSMVPTPPLGGN